MEQNMTFIGANHAFQTFFPVIPSCPVKIKGNRQGLPSHSTVQPPKWSRPRNDPQIDRMTPKWSQPWNDPHFSSRRPRNDPPGITEWWLNMGLWITFLFIVEMLQSCHFSLFLRSLKQKETSCRVTVSFQSRSSRPLTHLVWFNV